MYMRAYTHILEEALKQKQMSAKLYLREDECFHSVLANVCFQILFFFLVTKLGELHSIVHRGPCPGGISESGPWTARQSPSSVTEAPSWRLGSQTAFSLSSLGGSPFRGAVPGVPGPRGLGALSTERGPTSQDLAWFQSPPAPAQAGP